MHKSLQYYDSLDEQQLIDAMDEAARSETPAPELLRAAANRLQSFIDTPPERTTCILCGTTDMDEFE